MKLLIKNSTIIKPESSYHLKQKDILIVDGIIEKIEDSISEIEVDQIIENENLHVSAGWVDFKTNIQDPGHEYKETIESGLKSASAGGFTAVVTMPNTTPPVDNASIVQSILRKAEGNIVDLLPAGTISVNQKHENLAEMYDMYSNGVKVFTDDAAIESTELMLRALEYSNNFGGTVCSYPVDTSLSKDSQMNEGKMSTELGMKGSPAINEVIRLERDLKLAEYAKAPLHISHLSSKEAVEVLKKNKTENISSEITSSQLWFSDEDLIDFDSNLKSTPPFRTRVDRDALINAVKDGLIDIISSNHRPENIENKNLEFEHAEPGMINLQTSFAILNTVLKEKVDITTIIDTLTTGPRKVLKLKSPIIKKGEKANLSLFNPTKKWEYTKEKNLSLSNNTPLYNQQLTGKPIAIVNNNKYYVI